VKRYHHPLIAKAGLSLGTLLVMMALLEGILRLTKEPPWSPDLVPFRVEPGGKLFEDDPALGYRLKPGHFTLFLADGHPVKITHWAGHERATSEHAGISGGPELWIFGCSYTYGWSLSDQETFPWLVQEKFPQVKVRNFAVPGYGDLQGLLRMREEVGTGNRPEAIVLVYASFHDERNAGLRRWQKTLIRPKNDGLGPQAQPRARLDQTGNLKIGGKPEEFWEIPGMRRFSIPHSIEKRWAKIEANSIPLAEISRQIIAQMGKEAEFAGGDFFLAGIEPDRKTQAMLADWSRQGGMTVDLSVDLEQPGMRNTPHDSHPGPNAHRIFARRLIHGLEVKMPLRENTKGAPKNSVQTG